MSRFRWDAGSRQAPRRVSGSGSRAARFGCRLWRSLPSLIFRIRFGGRAVRSRRHVHAAERAGEGPGGGRGGEDRRCGAPAGDHPAGADPGHRPAREPVRRAVVRTPPRPGASCTPSRRPRTGSPAPWRGAAGVSARPPTPLWMQAVLPQAVGCYRRGAWWAGIVLGVVTVAILVFAGLLGPVAIVICALILSLPVWAAWWWLAHNG